MISAYREYLLNYIIQSEDKMTVQELSVYFDEESGLIDTEKYRTTNSRITMSISKQVVSWC